MKEQIQQNNKETNGSFSVASGCCSPPSAAVGTQADGAGEDHADGVNCLNLSSDSMALPVTRHASDPINDEYKYLLNGIDTLDLGLYVVWGANWKRTLFLLNKKKQEAQKKGGLILSLPSGRTFIFLPGGKGENYRFHLQFEAYNLFIGKAQRPAQSPNVYLSINAKTLWLNGIDEALSWVAEDLKIIGGGAIHLTKPSRVDLCTDFLIPGGLSYDFLLSNKITRNDKGKLFLDRNELETYYVGDKNSPVQLRIYNKGLEVKQEGTKLWFLDLWKRESTEDVWRFEFQLRRPVLKQFGINSLYDLKEKQDWLWQYFTTTFFSLRIPDNDKAERRTIHPLWSAVQESFGQVAPENKVRRFYGSKGTAAPEWHLSHIEGCLSSLAAHMGITNRNDALQELSKQLNKRSNEDFEAACIKKAIQKGTLSKGGGI